MPVLVEVSPGEEAGSEGDTRTLDLTNSAEERSPKGTNRKECIVSTVEQKQPSALLTEQPTISDLQSLKNGISSFSHDERSDTESKEEERQETVASAARHTPSSVAESTIGSVPSQEFSERRARARELKEKMQVMVEVAHQKSASMSLSAASSKTGTLAAVKLPSPASHRLRRQLDLYKDIPRSLAFLTLEDKSARTRSRECDEDPTTYDGSIVSKGTSFAISLSSESDILTSVSQLESSVAYPQLDELTTDDSSDQFSQQISLALSNWTDAADSAAHHDPRCCDAFLVPNPSMLEYPESRQTIQGNATLVSSKPINPSIGDYFSFLSPIQTLASMEV